MTPIVNKTLVALLLLVIFSVSATAQQCVDSDHTASTAGNSPHIRGDVTVTSSTGTQTRYQDICDPSGTSLREFFCSSSGGVSSAIHQGLFGCLDGALVKEGGDSPACFTDIVLAVTPSANTSSPPTLSVLKATREIDRLWWAVARAKPQHNDSFAEVVIRDGAGKPLATRYSSIVPEFFDIPATRAISRVTLPFLPNARSIVFKTLGAELVYTLPSHLLGCSRPPVPIGLSGIEGIQGCAPGGQKLPINPTTFTCVAGSALSSSSNSTGANSSLISR